MNADRDARQRFERALAPQPERVSTSRFTEAQVRAAVEAKGASLAIDSRTRRLTYEAVAPVGQHWEGNASATLVSAAFHGRGTAQAVRADLMERLAEETLVPCSEQCGWCNTEEEYVPERGV